MANLNTNTGATDSTFAATDARVIRLLADMREREETRNRLLVSLADALIAGGGGFVDALRAEARQTVAGTVGAEYLEDAAEDRTFHLVRRMLDAALPA